MSHNVVSLKEDFIKFAKIHGEATESGDSEIGNHAYFELEKIANELLVADAGISALKELLSDMNISVKSWAATFLLPKHKDIALPALKEVASQDGLVAFSAKQLLMQHAD